MSRVPSVLSDNGAPKGEEPLYDRLERALIALEYALADARAFESAQAFAEFDRIARSQDAMQAAGEEIQDVLLALRTAALRSAARRAGQWS